MFLDIAQEFRTMSVDSWMPVISDSYVFDKLRGERRKYRER
jgi:hypothetical protein